MAIIPLTDEDKIKLEVYSHVNAEEVGEYTRQCMRAYDLIDSDKKIKILSKIKKRQSLEESLLDCAVQHSEANEESRKKINKRAMGLIKRCCRGKFSFVKEYVKLYKEMRNCFFSIADIYDEELEVRESSNKD